MSYSKKSESEKELELGIFRLKDSWHYEFKNQLYIFIGGIDKRLTELDILKVFSQYGNITDFFFLYDYKKKIRKNSCFLKYENFESCVLAIDNLNNFKLLDGWLRVSHTDCKLPEHDAFKTYHQHIKKKLDEAIIYEGDDVDNESEQIEEKKTKFGATEDPMHMVSDELLDF
ncbi:hypothetical protein ACO0SA_004857 [Hanseniaspora valbyensis]